MLTSESRLGVRLLQFSAVLASLAVAGEPVLAQPESPGADRRPSFGVPGGTPFPTFDSPLMSLGRFGRDEEFVKQLQLTEEQQEQIDEIRRGMRDLFRIQDPAEQAAKVEEMNQAALEVLTPEQTQVWDRQKAKIVQMRSAGQAPAAPGQSAAPGAAPATPKAPVRKPPIVEAPAGAVPSASFGGDPAPGTGSAATLTFNFRYAPWTEVLKMFAEVSGLTLDLNDVPPGTFNYYDERTYTPTEALDILNGYLLPRGYVLIRRDRFLACVNTENKIPPNMVPTVSVEELEQRGRNEMVTLVLPLEGLEADKIQSEVKELLGPQGTVAALKNTNSLVITDIASHVRRVHALLSGGAGAGNRETDFKAIPLKYMSATEAERSVRRLFGLLPTAAATTATSSRSSSSRSDFFSRDRGDRGGFDPREAFRGPTPAPAPTTTQSQFANKLQISADIRTNSLLVTASSQLVKVVEEVVKSIDVDIVDEHGNRVPQDSQSVLFKSYTINGGDVAQVALTLSGMYPGLIVGQDDKYGKIHVNATASEHAEIEKLIAQLGGESEGSVAVIPLSRMEPVQASNTLRSLFSGDGSRAPSIEPDVFGRRLMVRGTPEQVQQVKSILTQMGEDGGTGTGPRSGGGPVRRVPIDGRDPEEFLPLIQQAWGTSGRNPIRVVVPSIPNPIRDRRVPSEVSVPPVDREPLNSSERQPRREKVGGQPSVSAPRRLQVLPASQKLPADQPEPEARKPETEKTDASPAEEPAPDKSGAKSPIGITVMGNDLIITSADEKALDRLEEMISQLSAALPNRTRWTVFYLRSADATEAAQLLERLFPQSSVAASTSSSEGFMGSFTGGLSSFGRGMMNATGLDSTLAGGQPLKIITDIRSNALFVTGPSDQVGEIEQVLQLIDASELPESLRTRVPRSIPVEYSSVTEVAKIVREVYKDALEPEQPAQNQRGANPFAMMMGGAPQGKQRGIELTVGVDEQTNHLIVSCNDSMFRQIENLVQTIDERERDARRTIRVVPLEKADPMLLSRTLGSVIPKVTVSGGGSRPSRDRSDASSTSGQPNSTGSGTSTPQATPGGFPGGFPGGGFPGGGFSGGGRGGDSGGGRGGDSSGRSGFGGFGGSRGRSRGSR